MNPRAGFPTYALSRGASSATWVFLQSIKIGKTMAERVGFEPTVRYQRTPVFKTGALNHSTISPQSHFVLYKYYLYMSMVLFTIKQNFYLGCITVLKIIFCIFFSVILLFIYWNQRKIKLIFNYIPHFFLDRHTIII